MLVRVLVYVCVCRFLFPGPHPAYLHDLEADPRRETPEVPRRLHGNALKPKVRQGRLTTEDDSRHSSSRCMWIDGSFQYIHTTGMSTG